MLVAPTVDVLPKGQVDLLGNQRIDYLLAGILEADASVTIDPSRFDGQLFDIVKMEERETWTARFLRTEAGLQGLVEVKKTFDGCTFSKRKQIVLATASVVV